MLSPALAGRNSALREKGRSDNMKITSSKTHVEYLQDGISDHEYFVGKDTQFTLALVAIRNKSVDTKVKVILEGSNADATIIGVVIADKTAKINLHTMQIHQAHDTTSNLLVKTALSGNASCVIDGGIRVEKQAQKTDAYQRNENLLLSEHAHAESKPSLEILANDVRCTHGATVGPVSAEELWYLTTRGVSGEQAEKLIVSGFLKSALDKISDQTVRDDLWKKVESAI